MRFLVVVLLLVLLPLHLSWAAVAPYCAHEVEPQSQQHAGHDDHAAPVAEQSQGDADADLVQPECGHCHSHCTGVTVAAVSMQTMGTAELLVPASHPSAADQAPPRPERPQWAGLA